MFKGSEYWGYTHQKWNGTYKSAEEQLEEMDKQWNKMIIKEFLTVCLLFWYAVAISVSITVIIGFVVGLI